MIVSEQLVLRWFKFIGPYTGSMRETSAYPPGRSSEAALHHLSEYLDFISKVSDVSRLVFADEKPMKERDIFRKVRRDVRTGTTPRHTMNANSKNRYNILAAVTIKENVSPVEFVVLQTTTTAQIFMQFVRRLIEGGILKSGDIFIVDNCSVQ